MDNPKKGFLLKNKKGYLEIQKGTLTSMLAVHKLLNDCDKAYDKMLESESDNIDACCYIRMMRNFDRQLLISKLLFLNKQDEKLDKIIEIINNELAKLED